MRNVRKEIDEIVKGSRVVIFMKGSPQIPMCGFSAAATQILGQYTRDLKAIDVLQDPEIRQGVKEYSNWPTIPQVYVDGKFVGGSDILRDLHESGELAKILAAK
jgi:monothiol glutaredoxin